MRNLFKPFWQYLVGQAESEQMRALRHLRERYPEIYHSEKPLREPVVRRQAVIVGFFILALFVSYAWIAHFFGLKK